MRLESQIQSIQEVQNYLGTASSPRQAMEMLGQNPAMLETTSNYILRKIRKTVPSISLHDREDLCNDLLVVFVEKGLQGVTRKRIQNLTQHGALQADRQTLESIPDTSADYEDIEWQTKQTEKVLMVLQNLGPSGETLREWYGIGEKEDARAKADKALQKIRQSSYVDSLAAILPDSFAALQEERTEEDSDTQDVAPVPATRRGSLPARKTMQSAVDPGKVSPKILLKAMDTFDWSEEKKAIADSLVRNMHAYESLPSAWRTDKDLARIAVAHFYGNFKYADKTLQNDRSFMLEILQTAGSVLEYASEDLKKEREVVMTAVRKNGYALRYADPRFRQDREIVLEAVKTNGNCLDVLNAELKDDPEIVMWAVTSSGRALSDAGPKCKDDKNIVLQAIKNGAYISWASYRLQRDSDIIRAAVTSNPTDLQHAGELRDDYDLVLQAVQKRGHVIKYASSRLQNNETIITEALRQDALAIRYLPAIQGNERYACLALESNGLALEFLPAFQGRKDMVQKAVTSRGLALKFASDDLKDDDEIVRIAVEKSRNAYRYASERLRADIPLALKIVRNDARKIIQVPDQIKDTVLRTIESEAKTGT